MKGVRTGVVIALVGISRGRRRGVRATQITSAEIKDGTIQAKDIKSGTITTSNLSAAAPRRMTGPAGPRRTARRSRRGAAGVDRPRGRGAARAPAPPAPARRRRWHRRAAPGPQGDPGDAAAGTAACRPGPAGRRGEIARPRSIATVANDADDDEWITWRSPPARPAKIRSPAATSKRQLARRGLRHLPTPETARPGSSIGANWADTRRQHTRRADRDRLLRRPPPRPAPPPTRSATQPRR